MKIVLVGYMGSGKSTIGKEISKIVGIPFYDLDMIIEKREQTSIKNIFETKRQVHISSTTNKQYTSNNEKQAD